MAEQQTIQCKNLIHFDILSFVSSLYVVAPHAEHRFANKVIRLNTDFPDTVSARLMGDPDRLQQLFNNILENSLRYTDKPGILEIRAESEKGTLQISFRDSAPGVEAEQLPHLFERLYRGNRSRHRTGNGAGLGLSICENIVKGHQGTITAHSYTLGGLEVRIEQPLAL